MTRTGRSSAVSTAAEPARLQFGEGRFHVVHLEETAFLAWIAAVFGEGHADVVAGEHHVPVRRVAARLDRETHHRFIKRRRRIDVADREIHLVVRIRRDAQVFRGHKLATPGMFHGAKAEFASLVAGNHGRQFHDGS